MQKSKNLCIQPLGTCKSRCRLCHKSSRRTQRPLVCRLGIAFDLFPPPFLDAPFSSLRSNPHTHVSISTTHRPQQQCAWSRFLVTAITRPFFVAFQQVLSVSSVMNEALNGRKIMCSVHRLLHLCLRVYANRFLNPQFHDVNQQAGMQFL